MSSSMHMDRFSSVPEHSGTYRYTATTHSITEQVLATSRQLPQLKLYTELDLSADSILQNDSQFVMPEQSLCRWFTQLQVLQLDQRNKMLSQEEAYMRQTLPQLDPIATICSSISSIKPC